MIKDIHFGKKRGRRRREEGCVNADSAASDKRRPFLTANAEDREKPAEEERRATLSWLWVAEAQWLQYLHCQLKGWGFNPRTAEEEHDQPCSNDKASFTLRHCGVMDPTSSLLWAAVEARFNLGSEKHSDDDGLGVLDQKQPDRFPSLWSFR